MEIEKNIEKVVELIKNASEIVVFTGAGVSTNCGIPDFRSEGGLYDIVEKQYNLPYPEAIFDIAYFKKDPYPFFHLSKTLLSKEVHPSIAHKFVAWLEEENKIKLVVTQNIDMLHTRAGSKKVMECHGTYQKGHCRKCGKEYRIEDYKDKILNEKIPLCLCGGIIKPDIVFYGEQLPEEFYQMYTKPPKADLVMILGSSLTTEPAAGFAREIASRSKSLMVNYSRTIYDNQFDYVVHSDLDEFFAEVWKKLKNE
jgi:NAD-dependent SIR2 family protein deacetylase